MRTHGTFCHPSLMSMCWSTMWATMMPGRAMVVGLSTPGMQQVYCSRSSALCSVQMCSKPTVLYHQYLVLHLMIMVDIAILNSIDICWHCLTCLCHCKTKRVCYMCFSYTGMFTSIMCKLGHGCQDNSGMHGTSCIA